MQNLKKLAAFALSVSLFGLILAQIIVLGRADADHDPRSRALSVGLPFGLLCVFGVTAVLRPGQCSKIAGSSIGKKRSKWAVGGVVKGPRIRGHHPVCEGFSSHVFRLGGGVFCVGCTGLLTGAVISLVGSLIYFFLGVKIPVDGLLPLHIGGLVVGLSLLQFAHGSGNRILRFLINTTFPLGALLILVSVDQRAQSIGPSLFVLLLVLFWIITRVLLARLDHNRICRSCELTCNLY